VGSLSTFRLGVFILLAASSSGCATFHYLLQAGKGQLELLNKAKPISEVVQDERTPPRVRRLLGEIASVKKFGEANGIKPTSNYTEYVKIDRQAAVWVVSASQPLKFVSKEWRFPIVGAFPYLGWFDLDGAKGLAEDLKKEGLDVDLRGARAFSTIGYFRDAVVSTMIPDGDEAMGYLVNVVLHESVHATIYISGQAYFNESIASFVADHLTVDYLEKARGKQAPELLSYVKSEEDGREYEKKMHAAYEELAAIYASKQPDPEKLAEKQKILAKLQEVVHARREINNATLIQYKTYNTGTKEFDTVLSSCGGSWSKFLGTLLRLKPESFTRSQQDDIGGILNKVAAEGCSQKS
jgi:predicted aminopeptidase